MNTEEERQLIRTALSSTSLASSVNEACRNILLERIKNGGFPNSYLKEDLQNLLNLAEFNVEFVQKEETVNIEKRQNGMMWMGLLGILGVLGIGSIFADKYLLRLIGGGLVGFVGYGASLYLNKPKTIKRNKIVLATTADDIIKKINSFYERIYQLLERPLIKTKGDSVFVKSMYEILKLRDDKGKEIKECLKEILTDNFKVQFVDHEGEFANTDYFTYERYENLEKPETVLHALVSSKNNACIAKGIRNVNTKK